MSKYNRKGWHGNSHGHSLAAKGIRLYSRKIDDSYFYAQKKEQAVPMADVYMCVRDGLSFSELKQKYPDVDDDTLRKRAIKAIDAKNAGSTASYVDQKGVDETVSMAKKSRKFRNDVIDLISNNQYSTYYHPVKIKAIKEGLR